MTGEDRAAYRRRRMNDLLAEAEAKKTAAAQPSPVVEATRGGLFSNVVGVAILLLVSYLLIATGMTIGRFSGQDFADAEPTGTATVRSCDRIGPVSWKGFGYVRRCAVEIAWNGGYSSSVVIDRSGFFTDEKPGDTFEIGRHSGSRGTVGYSRPDFPSRGWVTAVSAVFWIAGMLPLFAVIIYLRATVKDLFRRKKDRA